MAETLRPVWLTLSETASRVKQRIHVVMQWGWAHGFCVANPVDVVDHLLPQQTRGRDEHQPAMPRGSYRFLWRPVCIPMNLIMLPAHCY